MVMYIECVLGWLSCGVVAYGFLLSDFMYYVRNNEPDLLSIPNGDISIPDYIKGLATGTVVIINDKLYRKKNQSHPS
jgi:hypothetical protein